MNIQFNQKKSTIIFLISIFAMTANTSLIAQENVSNQLKDFKIEVGKTNNQIEMTCKNGCAWETLSFSISKDEVINISEYGMTELKKTLPTKDSKLTSFLFSITKNQQGIKLKGIEGTAWIDLGFNINKEEKRIFNQMGTIR